MIVQVIVLQWIIIEQYYNMMSEMLFFYRVCWYGIKSSQHVKVWEIGGIHEKSTFEDLFWKKVSTMNKIKLWHISFID
jgi:hypothetical protein